MAGEVERHEDHVRRQRAEHAAEPRRLHRLRGGVIDLEDPPALETGDPACAAIEPGAEDHELRDPVAQRLLDEIVDQPRPGDA